MLDSGAYAISPARKCGTTEMRCSADISGIGADRGLISHAVSNRRRH
jgi:hypothetical protein